MATAKEILIQSSKIDPPAPAKEMLLNLKTGDFNQEDRANLEMLLKLFAPDKKTINVETGEVEFINKGKTDLKLQIYESDTTQIQLKVDE